MSRRFETDLHLDATPDIVWRALTEADTLTQWFAPDATIEPRPGGRYDISWGGDWRWSTTVVEAVPARRLRLSDTRARPFDTAGRPLETEAPVELVLEFHLEPSGDGTTLRLVHSGFGHGANWDEELDGISDGWQVELRVLQHYLARHAGRPRRIVFARGASAEGADAAWARLTAPGALFDEGGLSGATAGDRMTVSLGSDLRIAGSVLFALPRRHVLVQADNLGRGLLNVMVFRAGGASGMQAVLSVWDDGAADLDRFQRRAQERIDRLTAGVQAPA